jgi:alkylmercury lyase
MTSTPTSNDVAGLSRPGGARVAVRLLRLLAQAGRPVTRVHALDSVAEWGVDRATADALLDGWTERNDAGEIVGFGITYNPTPHRMTIDGVQMWAWCGMDTLIYVHILGKPAAIESTAPGSGEVVRLHAGPSGITDVDPAGAVATQRVPGHDQVDLSTKNGIWGTFCHHNLVVDGRPERRREQQPDHPAHRPETRPPIHVASTRFRRHGSSLFRSGCENTGVRNAPHRPANRARAHLVRAPSAS